MQAITPKFCGYRFRSRLEARWAVFFDVLGLNWTYEPEGFSLDSGWYLPDFWIENWQAWIEIKPRRFTTIELIKCRQLAVLSQNKVLLIQGQPWIDETIVNTYTCDERGIALDANDPLYKRPRNEIWYNSKYEILAWCHTKDQLNASRFSLPPVHSSSGMPGWYFGSEDDIASTEMWLVSGCDPDDHTLGIRLNNLAETSTPVVEISQDNLICPCSMNLRKAFTAARSARFEHGEQGYWAP